jgi:hypothetical protein
VPIDRQITSTGKETNRLVEKRPHCMLISISIIIIVLMTALVQSASCATDSNVQLTKTVVPIAGTCKDFKVTLSVAGVGTATTNPVDVILILDFSYSMTGTPLSNLKTAANSFIDRVLLPTTRNGNNVSVIIYSTNAEWLGRFDKGNDAKASYASRNPILYTNIAEAFTLAASKFAGPSSCGQNQAMVFMTDGVPNRGCSGCPDYPTNIADCCVQAAKNAAQGQAWPKASVFSIGLYSDLQQHYPNSLNVGKYVVENTANSGSYSAATSANLEAIFIAISGQLQPAVRAASVTDILDSDFDIISGSIKTTAGSASASSNTITWNNFNVAFGSTQSMSYNITPKSGICGDQKIEDNQAIIRYTTAKVGCPTNELSFDPAPHVIISCLTASIMPVKVCLGGTLPLLINGTPFGGIKPYTHLWTGAIQILSATNIVEPTITSNTVVGSYMLTYKVTDSRGCTATDTKTIQVMPRPIVSIAVYEGV